MSLLNEMMEEYILMEKVRQSDGEGGFVTTWEEGITFKACIVMDTTMEARIAEHEGVTSTYTVTTQKNVNLEYHDVLKRKKDGSIYRITSNGGEKITPSSSTLDMAQVTAERWELA